MSKICPKCLAENPEHTRFCGNCGTPLKASDETYVYSSDLIQESRRKSFREKAVSGKFEIIEKLGGGGMGVVYKARDKKLSRIIALKFLPHELTSDQEAKERFIQEAHAASVLDHPNICTIFDIDTTEEDQMFIVMAYYEGETLKRKITHGPLPVEEAINCAIQVSQGLAKAHSRGIVHRDIKPANIMVTNDGVVKILDFGLAKLAGQTKITKTAAIMGTAPYMSPEQAHGKKVDAQTDCWSLGVVMYEMLTGQLPFEGEHEQAVIYSILNETPIPPVELRSDLPRELERIILKCLQKQKKNRYQSAEHVMRNLTKLKISLEKEKMGIAVEDREKPEGRRETERRQATVMFAEVSGYPEMLEGMQAEDAASIMSRYFSLFRSVEKRYGGKIDKLTDNSLMVIFGVPKAIEDGPKKAVNSAIELRDTLRIFNQKEKLKIPLNIHTGINTGMVIAGRIGGDGKDFTVMGDTVNFAFRLKDISEKGKILVGPLTYRYTREEFEYKPLKSITSRGKKAPVFELLSEKARIYRAGLGTERMIYSEMVGRENELDRLRLHVLKVINGEGSIVNVIGEAGVGKSRLIAELSQRDEVKKVTILKGRALSIGKNLSFHPLIDIIKSWSGIKEEDSISESTRKLEKAIQNIYPKGVEEVFPFIATLMGMKVAGKYALRIKGIEGEALEKLILKNLRELFAEGAKQKPLVIVLEDLHWADLTSISYLESLYRLAGSNRILFVNVFRRGYEDTSERILRIIKSRYSDFCSDIVLESLNESHSEVLINNLLKVKGLVPNIRKLVVKKTGGNPFFIEEVVRSFIDDGVVEVKDGRFRITEKIDSVIVPETINEVLMARIDKLDEETRSLLKIASVIGRNFFYRILTDVAASIEEIDDRLDYLKETQLILERKRMAELEYLFKHALAQEVTYESILENKRKRLHLKIARSIESVFSGRLHEFYGMLAFHYSKGEDLEKAEEYLIRAGEEALKSSASIEALNYYQEALRIYLKNYGEAADQAKIAMLEKNIAIALFNKGQYIEADEYFARALSFYGEKLPKLLISKVMKFVPGLISFITSLYFTPLKRKRVLTQKDSEVINLYYKKNTALIFIDPHRMFIEIFYWLKRLINSDLTKVENGVGIISMSSAAFSYGGISFRLSRKILEFIQDKIDKNDVKSVLYFKVPEVIYNTFSGNWDDIEEYDDNLVKLNLRIGELFYSSGYILIHGYSQIARGNFDASQELAKKLYEIADFYENDYARASYYWFSTQVFVKFRKLHDALNISEEGIEFTDKTGFKPYFFSLHSFKARVLTMMGDMKEAERTLQFLSKIKNEINIVPYFLSTYYLSQVIFDLNKLEESIRNSDRSESARYRKSAFKTAKKMIKNSWKTAADITESYKLFGLYYWLIGKQKKALKKWEKAIKEGERVSAQLELSRAYMEVGRRLDEKRSRCTELSGISAKEYMKKAKAMFSMMDLQWDLEEMEKENPDPEC